ncbi:MAG: type II 3-dehydroquinate dehydratase [Gammaproteobacteria bacterium]|nr:MAG: type II 3-dehydroquinate dehydratase [Gammaproteobacteria bacterium]
MAKLLVINGPNLNLLGSREPEIYGSDTLEDINQRLSVQARSAGHELAFFQSNAEHELVDRIQQAMGEGVACIIINAGALTHTSVALRDALAASGIPFIEIHISNIHAREDFRHHSHLSGIAAGIIVGVGTYGYELALQAALYKIQA